MAEFRLIAHAERSPTTCIACGRHTGPFIDLNSTILQVPTTVGVMDLDIAFYLCVGDAEQPGCVVQMARMTGQMVDATTHAETAMRLSSAKARIEELESRQAWAQKLEEAVFELYGPAPEGATTVAEPKRRLTTRKKVAA
jgi:hypothetical protein